jgi:biotin operon repressor
LSNHLITASYKANLGTPMRKSVMVLLADKASDDGSGIWASKQTMADELCCSKQAVITTIKTFLDEGLLVETGQRRSPNGYTNCYAINVQKLQSLSLVKCWADRERGSTTLTGQPRLPVNHVDPTSQPPLPHQSTTLTQTPLNPPEPPKKPRNARGGLRNIIPDDWTPPLIASLPPEAKACAEQWTRASYEAHAASFAHHWRAKGRTMSDWDGAWASRVIDLHSQILRDQKSGTAPPDTAFPKIFSPSEQRAALESKIAFYRKIGMDWEADEAEKSLCKMKAVAEKAP